MSKNFKIKTMKKIILTSILGLALVMVCCNQEQKENELIQSQTTEIKDGGDSNPCCEVSCRRGSCKSYETPCNCTCIAGQPMCGGIGGVGGNDPKSMAVPHIIVEASAEQIALYGTDANYIRNSLHNEEAAKALEGIQKLLVNNGGVLSSEESIRGYLEHMAVYAAFVETQPNEVVDILSSLE